MPILGARPQIIKSAPIIREAAKHSQIQLQIVHTGQHYDYEMSKIFFSELELPEPILNLGVGSGSHAWQTGKMMIGLEKAITRLRPDLVLVPGDTNSTLAGALAAVKVHTRVAHVEAGARSYDMRMPEEVNRRLTDHCSSLLFAPTQNCANNLSKEGVSPQQIRLVGDTMYDALKQHLPKALKTDILEKLGLSKQKYAVVTVHRAENVDDSTTLKNIMSAMMQLRELVIVFPAHPRTTKRLKAARLLTRIKKSGHIKLIDPVGYHSMLHLVKNASVVFTDSGGLQKEAFWLHTPCITLRDRTEWVETVQLGANSLAGTNTESIVQEAGKQLAIKDLKARLKALPNPFGYGNASKKIIETFKEF